MQLHLFTQPPDIYNKSGTHLHRMLLILLTKSLPLFLDNDNDDNIPEAEGVPYQQGKLN